MDVQSVHSDNTMKTKMFIVKAAHFLLSVILFYFYWLLFRYNEFPQVREAGFRYNYFVTAGYAILLVFFNRTYNSYLFGYSRIRTLVFAQFLSQLFSVGIIYAGVSIAWNHWNNPMSFVILLIISFFLDSIVAYLGNALYFRINPPRKTLLLYRSERDRRRFGTIKGKPTERLYRIAKEMRFDGAFEEIRPELDAGRYEAVFVAGVNSHCRNGILKYCEENHLRGFFLPHIGDVIMQGAQHIQSFDSPVMLARRKSVPPEYRFIKRAFDMTMAALGLVILSPLMLITAAAIKLYDHGPAFYKQTRLTRDGKQFLATMSQSMRKRLEFA